MQRSSTGAQQQNQRGQTETSMRGQQRTATSQRTGGGVSSSVAGQQLHNKRGGGGESSGHGEKTQPVAVKPRVYDESHVDVTPKPLFDPMPSDHHSHHHHHHNHRGGSESAKPPRQGSGLYQSLEGATTPTDIMSNGSILNTNAMMTNGMQSIGGFPESSTHISNDSNQQPNESVQGGGAGGNEQPIPERERETSALFYIKIEKSIDNSKNKKSLQQNEEDGNKDIGEQEASGTKPMANVNLTETQTLTMLNIPSVCVSNEEPDAEKITENNKKYEELCKSKSGNDSYVNRGINTFNNAPKLKSTQTDRITITDKGAWCTQWDMYDSMNGVSGGGNEASENDKTKYDDEDLMGNNKKSSSSQSTGTGTDSAMGDNMSKTVQSETTTSQTQTPEQTVTLTATDDESNYLENKKFQLNAFFMERFLNQNTYQPRQAMYRGFEPLAADPDSLDVDGNENDENDEIITPAIKTKDITPTKEVTPANGNGAATPAFDGLTLEKLWTYGSVLSKERNISCMCWNKKNKDVLAVGYGKFEFNEDQTGLVCCWSLKNPEFPERYFKTDSGVTSVAFSHKHANLLAVGLFNGNILVFDVRNNNTMPLISTNESEQKHMSPVWHLKWTDRDRGNATENEEEMEVLMSVSSDGRVTQWMIRKGFESQDYLKLKRVMSKPSVSKKEKNDGFISRHSGGMCFDIWSEDKSIYICGTEEGNIHRCSTSYNEQYLDTYFGHSGPVYKLAWSPFLKNCFLSASSDWTIRLWQSNRSTPCLTFNSSAKAVYDICWSNQSATLFCCVNESAIEIWDLAKSTLDPIYVTNPPGNTKLTSISYSPNSDSLIVGTNDGSLFVYAIKNLPEPTKENALEEIIRQSLISQLETVQVDDEETKETIEQHQLDSLALAPNDDETNQNRKDKLDAFEARLEKVKKESENILKGKKKEEEEVEQDRRNGRRRRLT